MNQMSSTVIICEKPSQARNLRAALGNSFGRIVAARGHLLTLKEPHEANPAWARWSTDILCPEKPYGKKPVKGGSSALKEIREALKGAKKLVIATDCDREGLVIGREIADHVNFRGTILRAIFSAEDRKTLLDAFNNLHPISEFDGLYAAGKAREQSDQIFNLTLTRTVSVHLGGNSKPIGIGRVRTPTLGIVCQREQEIMNFNPEPYFVITAQCHQQEKEFVATYMNRKGAPNEGTRKDAHEDHDENGDGPDSEDSKSRLSDRNVADALARGIKGWEGPVKVSRKPVSRTPPRPHDLSSLQSHMGSRYKWPAEKTLKVAQTLYADLKLITYPRAECRYLPESQVPDAAPLRSALLKLKQLGLPANNLPLQPVIRQGRGRQNHYSDEGVGESSHHAIQPNVKIVDELATLWNRCNSDQQLLAKTIFLAFLEQTSEDARLEETRISLTVPAPRTGLNQDADFLATGRVIISGGWMSVQADSEISRKSRDNVLLPPIKQGSIITITDSNVADRFTRPPGRFSEGGIIMAMKNAWKYIPATNSQMTDLRERLKASSGIGTPTTRDQIIESLVGQGQLKRISGSFQPTEAGMALWMSLNRVAPELVDPGLTALWEFRLDELNRNPEAEKEWWAEVGEIAASAERARNEILKLPAGGLRDVFASSHGNNGSGKNRSYKGKRKGRLTRGQGSKRSKFGNGYGPA